MAGTGFSSPDIFLWIFVLLGEFRVTERNGREIAGPLLAHPAQGSKCQKGQTNPAPLVT